MADDTTFEELLPKLLPDQDAIQDALAAEAYADMAGEVQFPFDWEVYGPDCEHYASPRPKASRRRKK